jgi:hypothetical protein
MDTEVAVTHLVNLMASSLFYAPVCPIAVPLAAVGVIIHYWVVKYRHCNLNGMPPKLVTTVPMYWANNMNWFAFFMFFGFIATYNEIKWTVPPDTLVNISGDSSPINVRFQPLYAILHELKNGASDLNVIKTDESLTYVTEIITSGQSET